MLTLLHFIIISTFIWWLYSKGVKCENEKEYGHGGIYYALAVLIISINFLQPLNMIDIGYSANIANDIIIVLLCSSIAMSVIQELLNNTQYANSLLKLMVKFSVIGVFVLIWLIDMDVFKNSIEQLERS